jgi:hypothetical protein
VRRWLVIPCLLVAALRFSALAAPGASGPAIYDVESAFARIPDRGSHLLARAYGLIPKPRYRTSLRNVFGLLNHFQGIQRIPGTDYVVLSGSNPRSSTADLFVIRLNPDPQVIRAISVDALMTHAGGLSMAGSVLAVPIHGGTPCNAKVVFYDFTDPDAPRRLPVEISRPGRKASAVAFVRLSTGRYLVGVLSAFDGSPRGIDFYVSRSTTLDDGFVAEPINWRAGEVLARPDQERTFSYFQNINFVQQSDGRLYLAGFHNSTLASVFLPGRDHADLFEVIFPDGVLDGSAIQRPAIVKVASRLLRCTDGFCNLDAAAGLFVDPEEQSLSVYAAPGWLDGDTVKMTVYQTESSRSKNDR